MNGSRFVPLRDGRTAILGTVQSVDGSATLLRVIDTEAGTWAADAFPVLYGAGCFQSGDREDILFTTSAATASTPGERARNSRNG